LSICEQTSAESWSPGFKLATVVEGVAFAGAAATVVEGVTIAGAAALTNFAQAAAQYC